MEWKSSSLYVAKLWKERFKKLFRSNSMANSGIYTRQNPWAVSCNAKYIIGGCCYFKDDSSLWVMRNNLNRAFNKRMCFITKRRDCNGIE
jgi:hypothetical protein